MQKPTLVVTTFAIGKDYVKEVPGWLQSIREHSERVKATIGIGKEEDDVIQTFEYFSDEKTIHKSYEIQVPVEKKLLKGWNNLGFLKPFWILTQLMICDHEDIVLWVDVDARTRKDLNLIFKDLQAADLGLCRDAESWIAGTIAIRVCNESIQFFRKWAAKCIERIAENQTDWGMNDQTIMRMMIEREKSVGIIQLDKRWACIAPKLIGEFDPKYDKFNRDAIIWHWQASRKVKHGIDWPPSEEVRNKV